MFFDPRSQIRQSTVFEVGIDDVVLFTFYGFIPPFLGCSSFYSASLSSGLGVGVSKKKVDSCLEVCYLPMQ